MEAIEIIEQALEAAGYSYWEATGIITKFLQEEAECYLEAIRLVEKAVTATA